MTDKKLPAAALFDLDGVIIDTEPQYTDFWEKMGQQYLPDIPDFALKVKGQTMEYLYTTYFNKPGQRESVNAALVAFDKQINYSYIPGAMEFVKALQAAGVPMAIVTSSDRDKMENLYRAHPDFAAHFTVILTAEDCHRSKPAPDCYLTAAARLGVPIEQCVIFEDSFNGLSAARAAGGYVVALATTYPADILKDKANKVIEDFVGFELDA